MLGQGVTLRLNVGQSGSIDERLAKIELAKQNLLESLAALDELKAQADENKRSLEEALANIAELETQKTAAQQELNTLKSVADLDAIALKKLFDVPTPSRIWRERFYGLLTGVIASIIAAVVWDAMHGL